MKSINLGNSLSLFVLNIRLMISFSKVEAVQVTVRNLQVKVKVRLLMNIRLPRCFNWSN